ncbi:MAG: DUF883 C-terminal domain-containing protein [Bdellovibrionaceae bacterium]|nr:DUF883 C-terminal domain-containing protein [Pseudobdellovibrionaceae bacterium]
MTNTTSDPNSGFRSSNINASSESTYGSSGQNFANRPRMSYESEGFKSDRFQQGRASTFYRKGMDQSRRLYSGLRSHVDANPWMDIGIIAAAGLAFGYLLGSRAKKSRYGLSKPDFESTAADDLTFGRSY